MRNIENGQKPMTDTTLPQRLRARRLYLGVDQIELAEAIGKSRPLISAMEKGESAITTDQLEAMARVLRVPAGYFFGETEGQPEAETELQHAFRSLSEHGQKLALAALVGMLNAEAQSDEGAQAK